MTTTEVIASERELEEKGAHEFIRANSGLVERFAVRQDMTTTKVIASERELEEKGAHEFIRANCGVESAEIFS